MIAKNIKRAIFLDRDGVISPDDFGYLSNPAEYLYPYTIEALKIFKELDFLLFVVTNQSGIARGYFTLTDFGKSALDKMRSLLSGKELILMVFTIPLTIKMVLFHLIIFHTAIVNQVLECSKSILRISF